MAEVSTGRAEFRVGRVLSRSLAVLMRNFVPFAILALIFTWPLLFVDEAEGPSGAPAPAPGTDPAVTIDPAMAVALAGVIALILVVLFVFVAMQLLCTSTMAYGTFQDLRGRRVGVVDCLRRGLSTVFPVIGITILATVAIGFGFLALIVPGIILMLMFWVAVPVAVVERPGVFASLRRSAWLTKGHRWRIFGIVLVIAILNGVATGTVAAPFQTAAGGPTSFAETVLSYLVTVFFIAWGAVAAAVAYHDLRLEKEGVGVNEIAAVFD